ncbi:MAG: TIGR01777 family protein [Ignavibacteria bacterium]|nr:TIGR01777 family protein [Ignavibacteria bacterium]
MNTIILAGGSGFLGRHLATAFRQKGFSVITVSRSVQRGGDGSTITWDALPGVVDGATAVINLAGSNIGGKRWSNAVRHEILQSRLDATRKIVAAIHAAAKPPALINASAVGYYGNTYVPCNEAIPAGQTFAAKVVDKWEHEAQKAADVTRVAILRVGVVLDAKEGALPRLSLPMKLFIGGPLGSGRQWFPWVHRDDVVNAFVWAATTSDASGPYNVVAPEDVTMRQFARELGRVLHRPSWLRVPEFVLRFLLGRQADIVVHGQHVIPMRLGGTTFRFLYPTLNEALRRIG